MTLEHCNFKILSSDSVICRKRFFLPKYAGCLGEKHLCDWLVYWTGHFFLGMPFLLERMTNRLWLLKLGYLTVSWNWTGWTYHFKESIWEYVLIVVIFELSKNYNVKFESVTVSVTIPQHFKSVWVRWVVILMGSSCYCMMYQYLKICLISEPVLSKCLMLQNHAWVKNYAWMTFFSECKLG